ncbi:sarcocystatin-A-like [Haematobia irritans]|uniref:sarcocystatin-A-like n=1 Tax=Haematobia irritans TaxID=7368 RepID=UPI003F507BE9
MLATKLLILLSFYLTIAMAEQQVVGGATPVRDLKKVEDDLNKSLSKLATGDGPHYTLGKVYSATRQVVAGTKTKMVADLIDKDGNTKKCNVTIWARPWLPNGIQVTFDCDGEPQVIRSHDP